MADTQILSSQIRIDGLDQVQLLTDLYAKLTAAIEKFEKGFEGSGNSANKGGKKFKEETEEATVAAGVFRGELAKEIVWAGIEKTIDLVKEAVAEIVRLSLETAKIAQEQGGIGRLFKVDRADIATIQSIVGEFSNVKEVFSNLNRNIIAANENVQTQVDQFGNLRVAYQNLDGTARTVGEVFTDLVAKFKDGKVTQEGLAAATQLFGEEAGKKLVPVLSRFDDLKQKAQDAGLVLSDEAAQAAEEFAKKAQAVQMQLSGISLELGSKLIPVVEAALPALQQLISDFKNWIDRNPELIEALKNTSEFVAVFVADTLRAALKVVGLLNGELSVLSHLVVAAGLVLSGDFQGGMAAFENAIQTAGKALEDFTTPFGEIPKKAKEGSEKLQAHAEVVTRNEVEIRKLTGTLRNLEVQQKSFNETAKNTIDQAKVQAETLARSDPKQAVQAWQEYATVVQQQGQRELELARQVFETKVALAEKTATNAKVKNQKILEAENELNKKSVEIATLTSQAQASLQEAKVKKAQETAAQIKAISDGEKLKADAEIKDKTAKLQALGYSEIEIAQQVAAIKIKSLQSEIRAIEAQIAAKKLANASESELLALKNQEIPLQAEIARQSDIASGKIVEGLKQQTAAIEKATTAAVDYRTVFSSWGIAKTTEELKQQADALRQQSQGFAEILNQYANLPGLAKKLGIEEVDQGIEQLQNRLKEFFAGIATIGPQVFGLYEYEIHKTQEALDAAYKRRTEIQQEEARKQQELQRQQEEQAKQQAAQAYQSLLAEKVKLDEEYLQHRAEIEKSLKNLPLQREAEILAAETRGRQALEALDLEYEAKRTAEKAKADQTLIRQEEDLQNQLAQIRTQAQLQANATQGTLFDQELQLRQQLQGAKTEDEKKKIQDQLDEISGKKKRQQEQDLKEQAARSSGATEDEIKRMRSQFEADEELRKRTLEAGKLSDAAARASAIQEATRIHDERVRLLNDQAKIEATIAATKKAREEADRAAAAAAEEADYQKRRSDLQTRNAADIASIREKYATQESDLKNSLARETEAYQHAMGDWQKKTEDTFNAMSEAARRYFEILRQGTGAPPPGTPGSPGTPGTLTTGSTGSTGTGSGTGVIAPPPGTPGSPAPPPPPGPGSPGSPAPPPPPGPGSPGSPGGPSTPQGAPSWTEADFLNPPKRPPVEALPEKIRKDKENNLKGSANQRGRLEGLLTTGNYKPDQFASEAIAKYMDYQLTETDFRYLQVLYQAFKSPAGSPGGPGPSTPGAPGPGSPGGPGPSTPAPSPATPAPAPTTPRTAPVFKGNQGDSYQVSADDVGALQAILQRLSKGEYKSTQEALDAWAESVRANPALQPYDADAKKRIGSFKIGGATGSLSSPSIAPITPATSQAGVFAPASPAPAAPAQTSAGGRGLVSIGQIINDGKGIRDELENSLTEAGI